MKGLIDSGVEIKHNEKKDIFPEENRIKGKNLKEDFSKHFDEIIENFSEKFSKKNFEKNDDSKFSKTKIGGKE